ncbi:LysR family transcriptional regulator [uncultured Sulfitobacter sp.]|uniref:LysR family transcriptional regulator n=1 Tax=uncultured Sulfitobacter sp. TaxID=191468 RepID=UPI0025939563|nr:LysR family transcriptional regulator [uncultured Sulfitobacter sp.]
MDTRFLITVLSVADSGSFAASARQLNLTPAAVVQRVRAIESQLGVTLFARRGQRVSPTAACIALLPGLRRVVDVVDSLISDLDPTGLSAPVRLGAIATALTDNIPGVLVRFAGRAPNAQLTIIPGTSRELFRQVNDGQIDAAFLVRPEIDLPKSLDCVVLEQQPFVLITQKDDVRTREQILTESPALIYDTASWGGKIALPWLKKNVPQDRILCELDALETIVAAVTKGLGYAVIPNWKGMPGTGNIQKIALPDIAKTRDLVLLHRKLGPELVQLLVDQT